MTDYRVFEAVSRQWQVLLRDGRSQMTLLDLSCGTLARSLAWALDTRTSCEADVFVHLYWLCPLGALPAPPAMFRGDWVQDLPGIHRLESVTNGLTLTIVVGQIVVEDFESKLSLARRLLVNADIALVNCLNEPVDEFVSPNGLIVDFNSFQSRAVHNREHIVAIPCAVSAWLAQSRVSAGSRVMVVGAGIAGVNVAYELSRRGFVVTVLDAQDPVESGSVHRDHIAGALTPVVSADDNVRSRLSRAGALLADRLWCHLPESIGHRCGALQLQKEAGVRRQVDLQEVAQGLAMPDWAQWVDATHASELAGQRLNKAGLWLPGGWVIKIPSLLKVLSKSRGVSILRASARRLTRRAGQWCVLDDDGQVIETAPAVVLANAADALPLLLRSGIDLADRAMDSGVRRLFSMHRLAGEITAIPAKLLDQGPRCIVGGDGYVLPETDSWCISGGTYVRDVNHAAVTPQGAKLNVQRAARLLNQPTLPDMVAGLAALPGWAGWRAVVAGRLPVVGPVPDQSGLYLCTAGASRGLTWSVLQANLIADLLQARAPVLERELLAQIAPLKL